MGATDNNRSRTVELVLGNPAHGGACVAREDDGRVVFVRGGLPGERVIAEITSSQSRLAWANVVEVIEAADARREELQVEGLDLAHVESNAQLEWKTFVLNDQLSRIGGPQVAAQIEDLYPQGIPVEPLPGDRFGDVRGARTRARFVVTDDKQLGMHQFRSDNLVGIEEYPLLPEVFDPVFGSSEWSTRWRVGDNVTLVAPNTSRPLVLTDTNCWDLSGKPVEPRTKWTVNDVTFDVDARGFWQVHPEAPDELVDIVCRQADFTQGDNVIELYSGAGLFTYFIAARIGGQGRLVTLEQGKAAVKDAAANCARLNSGENTEFYQGRVDAQAVAELDRALGGNVDAVVMDPPRAGAGRSVMAAIDASSAKQVTIVACDPAAGARDIRYLVDSGWNIDAIEARDLFPDTHHFETIATLRRGDGYRGQ